MATHDNTKHSATQVIGTQCFKTENLVDMTALTPASGDTIQCIKVQEGSFITRVSAMVVVAEGANTLGFDLGDDGAVNAWDDAVSLNGSAKVITRSLEATDANGVGKYYSGADTIDMVVNDASVDTGKYLIIAEGYNIEDPTVISTL